MCMHAIDLQAMQTVMLVDYFHSTAMHITSNAGTQKCTVAQKSERHIDFVTWCLNCGCFAAHFAFLELQSWRQRISQFCISCPNYFSFTPLPKKSARIFNWITSLNNVFLTRTLFWSSFWSCWQKRYNFANTFLESWAWRTLHNVSEEKKKHLHKRWDC